MKSKSSFSFQRISLVNSRSALSLATLTGDATVEGSSNTVDTCYCPVLNAITNCQRFNAHQVTRFLSASVSYFIFIDFRNRYFLAGVFE